MRLRLPALPRRGSRDASSFSYGGMTRDAESVMSMLWTGPHVAVWEGWGVRVEEPSRSGLGVLLQRQDDGGSAAPVRHPVAVGIYAARLAARTGAAGTRLDRHGNVVVGRGLGRLTVGDLGRRLLCGDELPDWAPDSLRCLPLHP